MKVNYRKEDYDNRTELSDQQELEEGQGDCHHLHLEAHLHQSTHSQEHLHQSTHSQEHLHQSTYPPGSR